MLNAMLGTSKTHLLDDEDFVEFLQYRMFRKMEKMQYSERAAFLADIFGKRWTEVYERITLLYPALLVPNVKCPS
ncbi:MAG: hypothetical protein IV103_09095 [Zoogloea sp.]|nr:hypothetical protein [Zoogloea sp.]